MYVLLIFYEPSSRILTKKLFRPIAHMCEMTIYFPVGVWQAPVENLRVNYIENKKCSPEKVSIVQIDSLHTQKLEFVYLELA